MDRLNSVLGKYQRFHAEMLKQAGALKGLQKLVSQQVPSLESQTIREALPRFTQDLTEAEAEFGTAADPVSAAEGYAEGYRGRSHQAAFEGCLDGFRD